MVGLIWTIQLVHYPMFTSLDAEQFPKHMDEHQRLISFLVLPLMMSELLSSLALWNFRPEAISNTAVIVGLALLAVTWGSTFLIQVPQHTKLLSGYDAAVCQQLVTWNWLRTAAWTARGILTAAMMLSVLGK